MEKKVTKIMEEKGKAKGDLARCRGGKGGKPNGSPQEGV